MNKILLEQRIGTYITLAIRSLKSTKQPVKYVKFTKKMYKRWANTDIDKLVNVRSLWDINGFYYKVTSFDMCILPEDANLYVKFLFDKTAKELADIKESTKDQVILDSINFTEKIRAEFLPPPNLILEEKDIMGIWNFKTCLFEDYKNIKNDIGIDDEDWTK